MIIGIEAQRLLRKKKHGMDMVALQLIKALPVVAPQNEYVVFVRPGDDEAILDELKNVRLVYVNALTYADWEQVWLPLAILRNNIDLIHFTSNTASVFCPVPYVLTLHDVIFMEHTAKSKVWYQKLGSIYRQWIVPIAVRRAAKVVTVSHYESKKILEYFPEESNKMSVIYNAASEIFSNDFSVRSSAKLKNLPPHFFLFLGNTDPKKNTDNVLRAYAHYRQYAGNHLPLVIGDYSRSLVEKTLRETGEEHLMDDIISFGYLSQNELAELYTNATAFLYPSLRESFGIPIIEAMHSQCLVITSNTSAIPEVAGDAAMLVNPEHYTEIADAMSKAEKDKDMRSKFIVKGIFRASAFSWQRSAVQYIELYKQLISRKSEGKLFIQNT